MSMEFQILFRKINVIGIQDIVIQLSSSMAVVYL